MKELNDQNFEEFISSDEKVLVDFWAEWCGPCKMMLPKLEDASKKVPNRIGKINVDQFPDLASKFGIRSIPTTLIFKNGEMVEKKIGIIPHSETIVQMLN